MSVAVAGTSRRRWRSGVIVAGVTAALVSGGILAVSALGARGAPAACDLVPRSAIERELGVAVKAQRDVATCTFIDQRGLMAAISVAYPEQPVRTEDLATDMKAFADAAEGSVRSVPAMKGVASSAPGVVVASEKLRMVQLSMIVGDRMLVLTALNLETSEEAQVQMLQRLATKALAAL